MALRGGLTPKLPKLPSITGRKKKSTRPAYSIDLETERRKRPRIAIDELSRRGAAVLRERLPDLPKQDRRSAITKVLDILDVPRNVVANVLAKLGGVKTEGKRKGTFLKKVWSSELLGGLGVKKGAARSVAGFIGDVALDPLTYATVGATTGVSIGKHLPKILKPAVGMMKQAAKGAKVAPELVKALGMKGTLGKVVAEVTRRVGPKRARKLLMGRRGGYLTRRLAKRATAGKKEALEFIAKHGEKGRTLFRLPFAARGAPVLPIGAKARKMKAVQESLEAGGQAGFERIAQLKGRVGVGAAKAAEATAGRQALTGLAQRRDIGISRRAQATLQKPVTKQLEQARRVQERAKGQLLAFGTGPKAPGVIQEAMRAKIGPYQAPGAPGALAALRRGKRAAFGPPTTPMSQRAVGTQQQIARSGMAGARAKQDIIKELEPAIARLAAQTGRTADDVRSTIGTVIDAGVKGGEVGKYRGIDPIIDIAQREQAILRDPDVARIFTKHFGTQEAMRGIEKARGLDIGKIEPYAKRLVTPEAKAQIAMQQARVPKATERGRAFWREFKTPEGKVEHVLSSGLEAGKEADALIAQGAKETGKKLISKAQWDEWAQLAPGKRPAHIGPEYAGAPAFKGPQFQADLAESAGARAAQHDRRIAVADFRDWAQKLGAEVPAAKLAKGQQYAHMAVPNMPKAGSPWAEVSDLFRKAYPQQVADSLNDMTRVWDDPRAIESLLKASDTYLGFWKSMQLYHPAYILRNVWQNFFGGLMAGANPADVASRSVSREVNALRKALLTGDPKAIQGMMMQIGGRRVPVQQLVEFGKQYPLVGVGRTAQEVPAQLIGKGAMRQAGAIGGRVGRGAHGLIFRMNTWVEDTQRLSTWLHFMDRGMDAQSAYMKTLQAMPNLADLTQWERRYARRLFPFYSWMRKNGALQLFHYLPEKPAYAAMLPRFKNFVEGFRGKDNVPDELRPMWMQEQMGIQVAGGKQAGMVGLAQTWFPFEEVYQAGAVAAGEPEEAARRLAGGVRPELKMGIEMATGRDIFKRQARVPIREAVQQRGVVRTAYEAMGGRSQTALDSMLGLRPVREWGPQGRVAGMPTAGAAAGRAVLGGALQPVDYQRGLMARYHELNNLQRRIRALYNRALQAGDQSLADKLLQRWTGLMRQMHDYKFPMARRMEQTFQTAGVPQTGPP